MDDGLIPGMLKLILESLFPISVVGGRKRMVDFMALSTVWRPTAILLYVGKRVRVREILLWVARHRSYDFQDPEPSPVVFPIELVICDAHSSAESRSDFFWVAVVGG